MESGASLSQNLNGLSKIPYPFLPLPRVPLHAPPELLDVIKCQCNARHAAATNNTLHVHHTVITLAGMTVAIHTLWDKVLKLKKQGGLMLRTKIMRRILPLRMLLRTS